MKKYIPSEIEAKWQQKWTGDKLYSVNLDNYKKKYYVLAEFAYPSGDLHMGHWFTWGGADIFARFKRMQGYSVFFPNGFDAFGLPAENAAIKRKIHPQKWTLSNIDSMKRQYQTMGATFDFEHGVITCSPDYYKWNQWIFLKMFEKGIAYKADALANWCPKDQTVLADEQVVNGVCDRCGSEVVKKEIEQWFLKITAYADRLLWNEKGNLPASRQVDWPKSVMEGQNNWIGKREGTAIVFQIPNNKHQVEVFTTRGDTLYGATFLVIAPEHPVVASLLSSNLKVQNSKLEEIRKYINDTKKKTELEREENKDKTGVFTGLHAINPINGQEVPVWISDYAVMGFGTGALFGDAHDERDVVFAKKYGIPLKPTLITGDKEKDDRILSLEECFTGDGVLVDSGEFSGLTSKEAREKVTQWLIDQRKGGRKITYHLHDWSISRQRYWGTPIPIMYCKDCGTVPVPEKDLPVELPFEVDYQPTGKPPLATNEQWLSVKCPKCGKDAKRDTNTMDGFFDNSWYFFRYLDNKNNREIFDRNRAQNWLPLEIYFGGAEHTLGHTLYSRFFTKFLFDLGLINFEEYAKRRVNHGIVLGPDGEKMSKSRGNVVNPDTEVKKYGADAIRIHMAFFMPYEGAFGPWIPERVEGPYRFLQRVWGLQERLTINDERLTMNDLRIMHKTIKKVNQDLEGIKFNTAVASLMEWLNYLSKKEAISKEEYKIFLLLLSPFAPHITEQLWNIIGEKYSIHQQEFPEFDEKYLIEQEISLVIQVNGKVRDTIMIHKDILNNREGIENLAKNAPNASKYLGSESVKKVVYIPGKIINFVT